VYGRASGRSKKDAEQVAARLSLEMMDRGEQPRQTPEVPPAAPAPGPKDDTLA
jgi:ribonuclease III